MTSRVPRPRPLRRGGRLAQHAQVDLPVPHHAALGVRAAGLELRLDERDDRAAAVAQDRAHGPEDERERDERDVDDGEVRPAPAGSRRSASGR